MDRKRRKLSENAYAEEIRKGKCNLCGAEKECIAFVKDDTFLAIFPTREVFQICETCLARAFSLLHSEF